MKERLEVTMVKHKIQKTRLNWARNSDTHF